VAIQVLSRLVGNLCLTLPKVALAAISVGMAAAARSEPVSNPRLVLVCAPCHGFDGMGQNPNIPNLAGQSPDYLRRQILQFRSGERKHPAMNFFSGEINDEELEQLITYYSSKVP